MKHNIQDNFVKFAQKLSSWPRCDDKPRVAPAAFLKSHNESPEDTAVADDLTSHNTSLLFGGLDQLDDRSRDIINSRWLTDDKATLQTLADRYGVH